MEHHRSQWNYVISTAVTFFVVSFIGHVDTNLNSALNHQYGAKIENWTMPWFPNAPGQADNNPLFSNINIPSTNNSSEMPWFPNKPGTIDTNPQVDLNEKNAPTAVTDSTNIDNWTMPWMPSKPGSVDPNPSSKLSTPMDAPWTIPWFPNAPNDVDRNPKVELSGAECDDGITNIQQDFNPANLTQQSSYLCQDDREPYRANYSTNPWIFDQEMPPNFVGAKICINDSISYDQQGIPMYGSHRPIGAKHGEYVFVPPQRWLNSMTAGAIVMLYHPCADPIQVELLRNLVTHCLRRHIITASDLPSLQRPLVLVTWGHRLEMSAVAQPVVVDFIKKNALRGSRLKSPTPKTKDNKTRLYDHMLINVANVVSDELDSELCPNLI